MRREKTSDRVLVVFLCLVMSFGSVGAALPMAVASAPGEDVSDGCVEEAVGYDGYAANPIDGSADEGEPAGLYVEFKETVTGENLEEDGGVSLEEEIDAFASFCSVVHDDFWNRVYSTNLCL